MGFQIQSLSTNVIVINHHMTVLCNYEPLTLPGIIQPLLRIMMNQTNIMEDF